MKEKLISREAEEVIFYRREKESMYLAELGSYYRFDHGDPLFFEFIEDQIKELKINIVNQRREIVPELKEDTELISKDELIVQIKDNLEELDR